MLGVAVKARRMGELGFMPILGTMVLALFKLNRMIPFPDSRMSTFISQVSRKSVFRFLDSVLQIIRFLVLGGAEQHSMNATTSRLPDSWIRSYLVLQVQKHVSRRWESGI